MATITNHDQQAAASLGYAQSAISQQIATLEKAVGLRPSNGPAGGDPSR